MADGRQFEQTLNRHITQPRFDGLLWNFVWWCI